MSKHSVLLPYFSTSWNTLVFWYLSIQELRSLFFARKIISLRKRVWTQRQTVTSLSIWMFFLVPLNRSLGLILDKEIFPFSDGKWKISHDSFELSCSRQWVLKIVFSTPGFCSDSRTINLRLDSQSWSHWNSDVELLNLNLIANFVTSSSW